MIYCSRSVVIRSLYDNSNCLLTGEPTKVDVNLNIRSMGPISEMDMVGRLSCLFLLH